MNIQGIEPYIAGLMLLPITGLVMILPPLVGRYVDRHGPVKVILIGQAILVIAALVQAQFTDVSPAWFVLIGLGLFGLGWGVQQASTASAVTSALPVEASGLAIGSLWTFWNIGSSLTLAIGVMILRLVEHAELNASIAAHNITLSAHDQHVIRSLLSEPSRAKEILGELPADLTREIVPLFHASFMDGFSDAMLFLAAFCAVCFAGATLAALRLRAAKD
jgi:MFS family permease